MENSSEVTLDGPDATRTNEGEKPATKFPVLTREPFVMRISGATMQMTVAVVGVSMGVLTSIAIYSAAPAGSTMARLFDLGQAQGILPAVMLVMFSWGAILCGLRFLRVRIAERVSSFRDVAQFVKCVSTVPLDALLTQIDAAPATRWSPLPKRVRIVVRQWATKPSLQDALSLLNQQALADTEDIHHAYGVAKTFVWALPVLGLIGTVVGIALAVGDFGQLIGGNVDDVAIIKKSLVQVTAGLSFAFTTTLLGLLGALLLVLPSSSLQAREEKLVTKTEGIVVDSILPQLQRLYPEVEEQGAVADVDRWREALTGIAQSAVHAAATAANEVIAKSQESLAEWQRQRATELEHAADAIAGATGHIGEDLRTASDEFLTRLSLIRESMDKQAGVLREGLDRGFAVSEDMARRLDSAMERHDKAAGDLVGKMQAIQTAAESLLSTQASLTEALRDLTDGGTARTLESLSTSLEALKRQAQTMDQTLSSVADATGKLTECQSALQEGLRQIDSIELPSALNGLGRTLTEVADVLQWFQEPIVFQAVRASAVVRADGGSVSSKHA